MPSLKARLAATIHEEEVRRLNAELAEVRRNLAMTVDQLDKARSVRAPKIIPAATRSRAKGDVVRVLFGDLHGSAQDPRAAAAVLGDVKALDPDEIYIGGDMVDCGGFLAQSHVMGYVAETLYTYEDDIAQVNRFLDELQKAAPRARIEYLEGNHENRVERWCVTQTLRNHKDANFLRTRFAPEFVLNLKARGISYYRMSEYHDGLAVPGTIKRGKVFMVHGFSTAGAAAVETLRRTGGNVVYFHTHRAQSEIDRLTATSVIGAYNPGCLCRPQPLWGHSRPNRWTNGLAVEFVAASGDFLHVNVPIIDGKSLLVPFLGNHEQQAA